MSKNLKGEAWITSPEKRRNDLLIAASLSPIITVLGSVSAAAMYLENGVKPFFQQQRVGRNGQAFGIYKLRTMDSSSYIDGSLGTDDPRATRVGKVMRKLTLDEFPQVINILGGDMSIVGPRPLVRPDVDAMREVLSEPEFADWFHAYTIGRPGWFSRFGNLSHSLEAQTDGYYHERAALDTQYFENASPEFDRLIIREAAEVGIQLLH